MKRLLLALAALLPLAGGCNDKAGSTSDDDLVPVDAGDIGPDVPTYVDTGADIRAEVADTSDTPAELDAEPEPPEPTLIVVSITPGRAVYPVGLGVTPAAIVYDQYAVPMDLDVTWSVTPSSAATPDGARWRLEREGAATFRGCIALDDTGDLNLCGSRDIVIDAGPPQLEIFSPLPGAELLASESETILVTGRAWDSNGIVRVYVEGERARVDAEGNFAVEVRPVYGTNHIEVVASDGLNGRDTLRAVDVMWAPFYNPSGVNDAGEVQGRYDGALVLSLGQRFLDANVPITPPLEAGLVTTRDIAGLLELVLESIDLMSFVENPISDTESFQLTAADATLGEPVIDIRITATGLELFIGFPAIRLDTEGAILLTDEPLSLNGSVTLVASAIVSVALNKPNAEAPLVVEVDSINLALERAEPAFEAPEVNAIFELAEGTLFGVIESIALDTINDTILAELPAALASVVTSIEGSLAGMEVPLDLGLGGEIVDLRIDGRLASLRPVSRTAIYGVFDLDVGTTATPEHPDSRGAAMNSAIDRDPPFFVSSRIQVGVRVPLMNGILHSLWDSGLLKIDASDLVPPELAFVLEGVLLDGKLPPHLTPARADAIEYGFNLSIGQLQMTIWRGDRRDVVGINLSVGANIDVVGSVLTMVIQPEPTIQMWMIEQQGELPIFEDISALEGLFVTAVWPRLTEQLEGGLVVELPALDLSSIAELSARITALDMALVLDHPIEIREGYFVLDGGFDATATFAAP